MIGSPGGAAERGGGSSLPIRVLVVDDHEVVRQGVVAMLERTQDMLVCGQAGTREEAVQLAARHRPDVVLMDVRLNRDNGIEAMRQIRADCPQTQVLMLSSYAEDETVMSAIHAGATGYVLKQVGGPALVDAVRAAAQGRSTLDPEVTDLVMDRLRRRAQTTKDSRLAQLTPQEERVLAMLARGLTNRHIGEQLYLAEKTVKNHVSSIFAKLEVARRAEAAAYYTRHTDQP